MAQESENFRDEFQNEKLIKVRLQCWLCYTAYFSIWGLKLVQSLDNVEATNFIYQIIQIILQTGLLTQSYKGHIKYIIYVCYIQLIHSIVLLLDPWDKGKYRPSSLVNLVTFTNALNIQIHIHNLNSFLHSNIIYYFFTFFILVMLGGAFFGFAR